jgi:hypothetical protein
MIQLELFALAAWTEEDWERALDAEDAAWESAHLVEVVREPTLPIDAAHRRFAQLSAARGLDVVGYL